MTIAHLKTVILAHAGIPLARAAHRLTQQWGPGVREDDGGGAAGGGVR